jgi:hypothetical protein
MVAPLLLSLGLPFVTQVVAEALGKIDNPVARAAAESLGKVGDMISTGAITPEQMAEANRHTEAMAALQSEADKAAYEQVNESLRAEVASSDLYVRRMRPTFGYMIAVTWGAQMMAVAYVIIFNTAQANAVINAMQSLGTIWTVGLSVLGIYVYKRSDEKKSAVLGATPDLSPAADALDSPEQDSPRFNE